LENAKAEAEKMQKAAQEAAALVEQKLTQKFAAEKAAAEEELAKRLKEVSDKMLAERQAAEDEMKKHLEAERANVQAAQKTIAERAEAERAANEKLNKVLEEKTKQEEDFKRSLKEEREGAEKELQDKLKAGRVQAEEELAQKCAAEREAAAKETSREVKDKLEAEHAEAKRELERRLYAEHKSAEQDLANMLVEKHANAQQSFHEQLQQEKENARKEVSAQLEAEKAKAQAAMMMQTKSTEELLEIERAKMEKQMAEKLEEERTKVADEMKRKVKFAADEAETQYNKTLAVEKKRRRSIPGLIVSERSQTLTSIKQAANEFDSDSLEILLSIALEDDLEDDGDGTIASAKGIYNNLQDVNVIEEYIENEQEQVEKKDPELISLLRLHNLLTQAKKLGGEFDHQEPARVLQLALVSSAEKQSLRTIFDSPNQEEVDLSQKIFGDLGNFYGLKRAADWTESGGGAYYPSTRRKGRKQTWGILSKTPKKGRSESERLRSGSVASQAEVDQESSASMLSHSSSAIRESLTQAPAIVNETEFDSTAGLNFINILIYMKDKVAQECQRDSCHDSILDLAKQDTLRDEIYFQVLKQLKGNPSAISLQLGWELLNHLCCTTPPSPALAEFIRVFTKEQQEALQMNDECESWAEEETDKVLKALKGNVAWKQVGDFWESVFWCVDAMTGNIVSTYTPKLDEAAGKKKALR
jgi:hypothetical protein